ncbi:MAG: glycoside hydrolase family 28 protein [Opitutaceae bacterium]|jgi:polygalacturonase|nr:glycoside hydrolase family 28 protein [Opitutaceae bacterium]
MLVKHTRRNSIAIIIIYGILLSSATALAEPDSREPGIRRKLRALAAGPFVKDWRQEAGATTKPSGARRYVVNARGDGETVCTKEIQQAIDECASAGGGTVEFAPGDYVTGSLFIKSNVNFHIGRGVMLLGAQDDRAWPGVLTRTAGIEMEWPAAMLNVRDQRNVSITGEGTVNARGKKWWDRFWAAVPEYEKKGLRWAVDYDIGRPHMMQIWQSSDVTVQGLTLVDSPFWTLHVVYSMHVTIDGVVVNNMVAGAKGPSTDGINIDSSAFVVVQNCDVDCNDDCYCFKAGMNADGQRVNLPAQYSMFRNCVSRRGHGGITLGSDMSGGIRHVEASGIRMFGTGNGIRFKSAAVRGGVVEDVFIHDIRMESIGSCALEMNLDWFPKFSYPKLPDGLVEIPPHWRAITTPVAADKAIPVWRDITIADVKGTSLKNGIFVRGLPARALERVRLERVTIDAAKAGSIHNAKNWTVRDTRITGLDGQPVEIKDCEDVTLSMR